MHSFKSHISLPFNGFNNRLTVHAYTIAKVEQNSFTEASFTSLSDICGCSGGL